MVLTAIEPIRNDPLADASSVLSGLKTRQRLSQYDARNPPASKTEIFYGGSKGFKSPPVVFRLLSTIKKID